MEDVEENFNLNQTIYKCIHCDFRVETTEGMKEHLQENQNAFTVNIKTRHGKD